MADTNQLTARESVLPNGPARPFVREVGHGIPIVVVHSGPDFDHGYLVDLDRLAQDCRVACYDQRGRGR